MFQQFRYFLTKYYNYKTMKIEFQGRVMDDQSREFQKDGVNIKKRTLFVYQEGEHELIPVNVPEEGEYQKDAEYSFVANLKKYDIKGRTFITIKAE